MNLYKHNFWGDRRPHYLEAEEEERGGEGGTKILAVTGDTWRINKRNIPIRPLVLLEEFSSFGKSVGGINKEIS